jgi:hypothetical protein
MPIDPSTGFDPTTGMVGLQETHQPTGAIGAVMNLMNGQKSRDISQALQQHRAAEAQMAQQQADEYAARQERDDQIRQALAKLGPGAGQQDVIGTYLKSGGDVERVLPWMRAQTSASAKVDSARVKAGSELYGKLTTVGGQPPNAALGFLSGVYSPEEIDAIKATVGGSGNMPLPVPGAKAAENTAAAGLKDTQAQDIADTLPGRKDLLAAKSYALRVMAQAKKEKAATGGTGGLKPSTELGVRKAIAAIDAKLESIAGKRDPLTMRLGPADKTIVEDLKTQREALKGMLDDSDIPDDDAQAAITKPGAAKGSPDPFGSIGFLKKTSTPAGGTTTAAGGLSTPPPDNRLGLDLPK